MTSDSSVRSRQEEGGELRRRLGSILLREKMPAGNGAAGGRRRPSPPDAERAARRFVPALEPALLAPQRQHRTGDAAAGGLIGPVHRRVEGDGSPVFLAYGMDRPGVAQCGDI